MPAHGHRHLTLEQRCQIYALKKSGCSMASIAKEVGVHRSTIYRELGRNTGKRGYRFKQAHDKATERRRQASSVPRKLTPARWQTVTDRLSEGWSPEQISGRLRLEGQETIGPTWIYHHVRKDRKSGGSLFLNLRRRGKKPNWRGGRHSGRGLIPNRVGIENRPEIVSEKSRVGDWEIDTIVGSRHRGAIVSMVDRASKFTVLNLVETKSSEAVTAALQSGLSPYASLVLTLTSDNGKEFANHSEVARTLDSDFYFANPYHSWERGLNEHTNGLVREYFPKGTNFLEVHGDDVQAVADRLNWRPRKCLQFRTPFEIFEQALLLIQTHSGGVSVSNGGVILSPHNADLALGVPGLLGSDDGLETGLVPDEVARHLETERLILTAV